MRIFCINHLSMALLSVALSSCSLGVAPSAKEASESAKNSAPTAERQADTREYVADLTPTELLDRVTGTYSDLKTYKLSGLSQRRSDFNGEERSKPDVRFKLDYTRGEGGTISWDTSNGISTLHILGKNTYLQEGNGLKKRFTSTRSGITTVSLTEEGWSQFLFGTFVFRHELGLGDKFFRGVNNLKIVGETNVEGYRCYLLTGDFAPIEGSSTYLVDKSSYLIRGIERVIVVRKKVANQEYVTTTRMTETYYGVELGD